LCDQEVKFSLLPLSLKEEYLQKTEAGGEKTGQKFNVYNSRKNDHLISTVIYYIMHITVTAKC